MVKLLDEMSPDTGETVCTVDGIYIFFLLPVEIFISLDSFDVSGLVLEISAV